ncbi:hypothetical protein L3Q82_010248, partial [Scortum barcoo]
LFPSCHCSGLQPDLFSISEEIANFLSSLFVGKRRPDAVAVVMTLETRWLRSAVSALHVYENKSRIALRSVSIIAGHMALTGSSSSHIVAAIFSEKLHRSRRSEGVTPGLAVPNYSDPQGNHDSREALLWHSVFNSRRLTHLKRLRQRVPGADCLGKGEAMLRRCRLSPERRSLCLLQQNRAGCQRAQRASSARVSSVFFIFVGEKREPQSGHTLYYNQSAPKLIPVLVERNITPVVLHALVLCLLALCLLFSALSILISLYNSVSNPYETYMGPIGIYVCSSLSACLSVVVLIIFAVNFSVTSMAEDLVKFFATEVELRNKLSEMQVGFFLVIPYTVLSLVAVALIYIYDHAAYTHRREQQRPTEDAPKEIMMY